MVTIDGSESDWSTVHSWNDQLMNILPDSTIMLRYMAFNLAVQTRAVSTVKLKAESRLEGNESMYGVLNR